MVRRRRDRRDADLTADLGPFEEYVDRIGDRTPLYAAVRDLVGRGPVLYPGSYLDLAPLSVWEEVVFVDNDPTFARRVRGLRRVPPGARFVVADYREPLPDLAEGSFAVLVSLYAGPVSRHCTRYLRIGGHLLANNSHGDASLAVLDPRYRLAGVQTSAGAGLRTSGLERYAEPRRPEQLTVEAVLASGRGVAFRRSARHYVFRRVS